MGRRKKKAKIAAQPAAFEMTPVHARRMTREAKRMYVPPPGPSSKKNHGNRVQPAPSETTTPTKQNGPATRRRHRGGRDKSSSIDEVHTVKVGPRVRMDSVNIGPKRRKSRKERRSRSRSRQRKAHARNKPANDMTITKPEVTFV